MTINRLAAPSLALCIAVISPLALRAAATPPGVTTQRVQTAPRLAAGDWRTIETPHFRVHHPAAYAEWATRAATRLESIRSAVAAEIGFLPAQVTDVLVMNPTASANGMALPLLDAPRMILYTEPPDSGDHLGAYGHWIDLLATHETAHTVHLLRPSRNVIEGMIGRILTGLGSITITSPRWVMEGYATVLEGRLTGAGRPNSTIRALILRQWALNGRLPTYDALDSDAGFLGGRMAYFVGSAFMEWLERRRPRGLQDLWVRMSARKWDGFDDAFADVYGEEPRRLYGRFTAQVIASAVAIDRATTLQQGELFQETRRGTGDPAVSPDGSRLAIVIRESDTPERLVIWSTGPPEEETKKNEERINRILARDPEDIRPARIAPLRRKELHALTMPDGGDISTPRWTRDGKALLFSHRVADPEGLLRHDLYKWDFEELVRVTNLADVRDADPLPGGTTAVAVRSRYGKLQLVDVDFVSGGVTARTEESLDVIPSRPRVSPDGRHVAHVLHEAGARTLVVDDRRLVLPGDPQALEWLSNEELVVSLFAGGFAELHRVKLDGTQEPITATSGGAFDPTAASDGRVFFMSLEPDGYVVRVLTALAPASNRGAYDEELVPALPPTAGAATVFADGPVSSRPYGIGRQEFSWFAGMNHAPRQQSLDVGIRLGDVVGRLDTLLVGSIARRDAPSGLALTSAWRGFPVELHGHAFARDDDQCEDSSCLPLNGLELRGVWGRRWPQSRLTLEAGALSNEHLFASAAYTTFQTVGDNVATESAAVEVTDERYRARAGVSFRSGAWSVGARYERDGGSSVAVGGLPSTIMPRSAYSNTVLDGALPIATLSGDGYSGWRIETSASAVTAFYQRHEVSGSRLSLAGLELTLNSEPLPIVKFPGLDFTAGVAHVFDAPLEGDTRWWIGMRWRP